jgi:excisionase family DNA binding protein
MPTKQRELVVDSDEDFVASARSALAGGAALRLSIGVHHIELDELRAETVLDILGGEGGLLADRPSYITTGQAAEMLGVSRPTVVALIDRGDLPATRVGTHRRLALADVRAHLARSQTDRRRALDEVTRLSQELGLYD